jgi:hypothetical protein
MDQQKKGLDESVNDKVHQKPGYLKTRLSVIVMDLKICFSTVF